MDILGVEIAFICLMLVFMVTAIYWPTIVACDGYCCSSQNAKSSKVVKDAATHNRLPYKVRASPKTLSRYSRSVGGTPGVAVINTFYRGLAALLIQHQPLLTIAKTAAKTRAESTDTNPAFFHKNMYPLITMSGEQGTEQEIYNAVYMSQALAKPRAVVILNGITPDSPAWAAWQRLVVDNVVHWKTTDLLTNSEQTWVKGTFKMLNTNKAVSEYMYDIMKTYVDLDSNDETAYYITSQERENEIRVAYEKDKTFTVSNLTSAFHAATLKILYPNIEIKFHEPEDLETEESDPDLEKAKEFLTKYILV